MEDNSDHSGDSIENTASRCCDEQSEGKRMIFFDVRNFSRAVVTAAAIYMGEAWDNSVFSEELKVFKDEQGIQLLSESEIKNLKKYDSTVQYSITFSGEIEEFGSTIDYAKALAETNLFSGADIVQLRSYGIRAEYAIKLAALEFNTFDIILLEKHKVTAEQTAALAPLADIREKDQFINEVTLWSERYTFLGIPTDQIGVAIETEKKSIFNDTEKPNTLIVYPAKDGTEAFIKEESRTFFDRMRKVYDTKVVVASREHHVYDPIENTPSISSLVLHCHGSKTQCSFGGSDPVARETEEDETYDIDVLDDEIEKYLSMLTTDAVILLVSCSNAKGGKGAKNLANFIAEKAKGRTVIAAKMGFKVKNMHMNSAYPLDVTINNDDGEDITYVIRK